MKELIGPVLILALYLFIVIGLLYTAIHGLRGRPIMLPNRSGIGGWTIRNRSSRLFGVILLLMLLIFLFPLIRTLWVK